MLSSLCARSLGVLHLGHAEQVMYADNDHAL